MPAPRSPDALNECFAIPGVVAFEPAAGLVRAVLTPPGAVGHIYVHGAHVTHHQPAGEPPLLFLSSRSRFAGGAAIRGGVPVVFPWFGARAGHPTAPDHGFARIAEWTVEAVAQPGDGSVAVTLTLDSSDATRRMWPHDFRVRQHVVVGSSLSITLEVENPSDAAFSFEEALHTYLRVGDVRDVSITGLEGVTYIDKVDGMKRETLSDAPVRPSATIDRVFLDTPSPCVVTDPRLGRRVIVEKTGSASTVIWNPWSDKAAAMTDMGAGEWRSMLCVEAGNVADNAVTLAAGERHAMGVVIRTERV